MWSGLSSCHRHVIVMSSSCHDHPRAHRTYDITMLLIVIHIRILHVRKSPRLLTYSPCAKENMLMRMQPASGD